MGVILFGTSIMSVAPSEISTRDCAAEAFEVQGQIEDQGLPKEFANAVANVHYEQCIEAGGS